MRFSGLLAKAKSARVIVGGAVLALGLVGVGLANADAAGPVSAHTLSGANFTCVSNSCQAGGVRLANGGQAGPSADGRVGRDQDGNAAIAARQRTVNLTCKADTKAMGREYHGGVQDAGWTGQWSVLKTDLTAPINDSGLPTC